MNNTENEVKIEQTERDKAAENQLEQILTKEKKSGWGLKIGIGVIAAAVVIAIVSFFVVGGSERQRFEECLSLGDRYLEELDYEQAIACYEEAITIDPKNVDAYLGIVEAYIRDGEYELALDYAQIGYEATGDDRLAEKVEMLQSGNITRSDGLTVMMTVYDDAGEVIFRHEYTYDRENIRNSVSHYDRSGNLIKTLPISDNESYGWYTDTGALIKISYIYEDNLITELHYDEDDVTVTSWALTELDDNGVSVRCIRGYGDNVGSEDEVTGYEEYGYDENGNAVTSIYDSDYQLLYKQVWERDEQGNTQRSVCYDENGNINWYCLYEYDKDGNVVTEREYDADDNLIRESVYE